MWETSSALFRVSSGSLPPTLPSLSSTPRCRWSRKHHSMSRKQDDGERMGTFAAVRVSSNRVERAPSFRYCCRPLPARSPLPAAGDIAPGPGQQLHTPKTQDVCSTWPQSPLQCKDQVSREQSLSFNRRLPAAVVLSSWIGHAQLERPWRGFGSFRRVRVLLKMQLANGRRAQRGSILEEHGARHRSLAPRTS